jgi:tRNA(adenine34) deaminase
MSVIDFLSLNPQDAARHIFFMREALNEAVLCAETGDVPIGAVAVYEERIIGRGRNAREKKQSPLWHAEMEACEAAAAALGRWNLTGVSLYVTKEPCVMCAGLIVQSRISECIFALGDKKGGGCGGNMQIAANPALNHRARLICGALENECLELIQNFFQKKRIK